MDEVRIIEEDTGGKHSIRFVATIGRGSTSAWLSPPSGGYLRQTRDGNYVVGYIDAHRKVIRGRVVYVVDNVFVVPSYRRSGVATRLYETAAAEACRRRSSLASEERNPGAHSHGFWEKQIVKGRASVLGQKSTGFGDKEPIYVLNREECPRPVLKNAGQQLYHGSNEGDLTELEARTPGYTGSLGSGVYTTTSPEFAQVFGKHLYEVDVNVPSEKVLYIETWHHDCGNDLTFYTPGSTPFTFELTDRNTGEKFLYSVLGDCAEEVRHGLLQRLLVDVNLAPYVEEYAGDLFNGDEAQFPLLLASAMELVKEGEDTSRAAEHVVDDTADFLKDPDSVQSAVEEALDELVRRTEEKVEERLGIEIDLDDLVATAREHGYSALFIEDYAPGDEFIVFDEEYLPLPVKKVT